MSRDKCKERRQKLICEFQSLLDCMEQSASRSSCPPPCMPCMSQIMCVPNGSSSRGQGHHSDRRSAQAQAKEEADRKRKKELEDMPLITGSAVLEIRPTSNLRFMEVKQPGVEYIDIRDHARQTREREKAKCEGRDGGKSKDKCYTMMTICDPCCPSRSQTFLCPVPCPSSSSAQFVCSPFHRDGSKTKDKPLPPWHKDRYKSRELKGGILLMGCDCTKRNGLQHDCRRTDCQGRPPCLLKPDPDCLPSGGTGLRGAEPRVSKYPYKPPECVPHPQRERGPPRPDPCHKAAVDCSKCDPTVLMCRPGECPGGRRSSDSKLYECRPKRSGSSHSQSKRCRSSHSRSKMFECRPKSCQSSHSRSKMYECRPKRSRSSHSQSKRCGSSHSRSKMFECRPKRSHSRSKMFECRPKKSHSRSKMFECRPKKSRSSHSQSRRCGSSHSRSKMFECRPKRSRSSHSRSKIFECRVKRSGSSHSQSKRCGSSRSRSKMFECRPKRSRSSHSRSKIFECRVKRSGSSHSKSKRCGSSHSRSKMFECRPKRSHSRSKMFECRPKRSRSSHSQSRRCGSSHSRSNMFECRPKRNRSSHSRSNMFECRPRRSGSSHSRSNMFECRPKRSGSSHRHSQRSHTSLNRCPSNSYARPDFCPPKYDHSGRERCTPSHPQPVQRILALQCRERGSSSRHSLCCPDPSCPTDPRCPPNPCCSPYCEPPTHILKRPAYEKQPPPPECPKPKVTHHPGDRIPPSIAELRGGQLYTRCDCLRTNGLQDDCKLRDCGIPECLFRPPECYPSGGRGPRKRRDSEHKNSSTEMCPSGYSAYMCYQPPSCTSVCCMPCPSYHNRRDRC